MLALESDIQVIFILFGNILNIKNISEKIFNSNKIGVIHIELIEGISSKEVYLRFLI